MILSWRLLILRSFLSTNHVFHYLTCYWNGSNFAHWLHSFRICARFEDAIKSWWLSFYEFSFHRYPLKFWFSDGYEISNEIKAILNLFFFLKLRFTYYIKIHLVAMKGIFEMNAESSISNRVHKFDYLNHAWTKLNEVSLSPTENKRKSIMNTFFSFHHLDRYLLEISSGRRYCKVSKLC